jgi:hypothetical protein|tara:strand:- start:424 stop:891 length:468 start_codon:yes stop_codon:yes gene_type:complete
VSDDLKDAAWEDLSPFRMDEETIHQVIDRAFGCTVTWNAKNGQSMGVWVSHVVMDDQVWLTTTGNRSKTRAWKRDPRTSVVFGDQELGSVTIVGTIELTYDAELRTRFLNKLFDRNGTNAPGREAFLQHMDTEGRMVGPLTVKKYITFDPRKLVT